MARKVLIVEDDSNIAELLHLYLEKEGFETAVAGLEGGADDYIVKPFEMKEVLARIHAVLRRFGGEEEGSGEKKLTFDKLVINLDSYELLVDGKRVDTPPKELELLYHLAASPNRVFTRNQLLDEVWGFDYFGDSRTVDVHIKRLREKLEGVSEQWSLKTVWGVGYKFEVVRTDEGICADAGTRGVPPPLRRSGTEFTSGPRKMERKWGPRGAERFVGGQRAVEPQNRVGCRLQV